MRTDDLDFDLPRDLIAQEPVSDRQFARLMHYRGSDQQIAHRSFAEIPHVLNPGDLLVFNDSRVIPARFLLRKESGGIVEALFLSQSGPSRWRVMLKNLGSYGNRPLTFNSARPLEARVVQSEQGNFEIEVNTDEAAVNVLSRCGRMPLPPYIKRDRAGDSRDPMDRDRYQTIYARVPGSVAAPTAGLHFTDEIMNALAARGVERCFVTLHVGLGTFKPIATDQLQEHVMHAECYTIGDEAVERLNRAKREKRRIVAVGTTAARVLESQPREQAFAAKTDQTRIFIYPPYEWRHVDALITNFHLPRSTLLALVAAKVGVDQQRLLYRTAIANHYRFFSYGDAMLLE